MGGRLLLVGVVACLAAMPMAGCYWLASYEDLTTEWGDRVDGATKDVESGDGPSLGFCASQTTVHALCADFDIGAFNAQFTTYLFVTPSTSLGIDATRWRSPPNSLLSVVPEAAASGNAAAMEQLFAGTASKVTYAFDLRVESWVPDEVMTLASIYVGRGPDQHELDLLVGTNGSTLEERFADGSQTGHALALPVPVASSDADRWTSVVITLDVAQRTCTMTLDGSTALAAEPIAPSWMAGQPGVNLGIGYVSAQGNWTVRYDNVTVDWQ